MTDSHLRRILTHLFLVLFAIVLLHPAHLCAQPAATPASPNDAPLTLTSDTRLVLVPVVVKRSGTEHVSGLTRDAFEVEERGQKRTVATFEELKPVPAAAASPAPAPLPGRSNFKFEDAPRGHLTIVLIDLLNTPLLAQGEGKRKLLEQLASALPPNEATVIFGLGRDGLIQLHAPTTNTAEVLAALQQVKSPNATPSIGDILSGMEFDTGTMGVSSAAGRGSLGSHGLGFMTNATWTTLTAFNQLADAYRTIPGRKTLIWASGGYNGTSWGVSPITVQEKIEDTWRVLSSANIAVYSLDVSQLAGFTGSLVRSGFEGPNARSLRGFAEQTGGLWCVGSAINLTKCLAEDFEDAGSYYMLGYYLPEDDRKPGWHKLKVKVNVPGAKVRARDGFLLPGADAEKPEERKRQLVAALTSPVEMTGVRINVREVAPTAPAAAAPKSRHAFTIGVQGDSIVVDQHRGKLLVLDDGHHVNSIDLSIAAIAFDKEGKEQARIDHAVQTSIPPEKLDRFHKTGIGTKREMTLAPGTYEIHFAVRDNLSGEIGTVIYPLAVK